MVFGSVVVHTLKSPPNNIMPPRVWTSTIFASRFWNKDSVTTPFLEECEDDIHTPEMGIWESLRAETSEFDYRGQNILHWGVLYIIWKLSSLDVENGLAWSIWIVTKACHSS
jgi:hypothetical protein